MDPKTRAVPNVQQAVPLFAVSDMKASIRYYCLTNLKLMYKASCGILASTNIGGANDQDLHR